MKKLQRLSLAKLAQEHVVLSTKEQMQIYAGSGINGLCYFEELEILSNHFGAGHDENYYVNGYASVYGALAIVPSSYTDSQGNTRAIIPGVPGTSALSYIQTQFAGHSISIGGYASALNNGGYIFTDINEGNGVSHAVVIIAYDPSQVEGFTYSDADGIHYGSAADFNTSLSYDVTGGIPH